MPDSFGDVAEGVATADIMALKVKATHLVERLRQEKATRLKAERKTQKVAGKVGDEDTVQAMCTFISAHVPECYRLGDCLGGRITPFG